MPAVKAARPLDIFTRDQWADLTRVSRWRGLWLVAHGWLVVAAACGGAALAWQYAWWAGALVTPLTIAAVGGRQLGLSILMHDAAHGLLHPNRAVNNFAGQWLSGAATGSDLHAYRTYHLTHHKYTQQPEDPDLALSAPFPTSKASLRRKIIRDLTGQTFYKQRSRQFAFALIGLRAMLAGQGSEAKAKRDTVAGTPFNKQSRSGVDAPVDSLDATITVTRTVGRFLAIQFAVLLISLATLGIVPFLIWLAALATTFQLFLRVRNIAEHACTTTGSDDPFSHARTTHAGWLARTTVAPYWVNYHSEHHLFMGVPCYNLGHTHSALLREGYAKRMTLAANYQQVLNLVVRPV